MPPNRQCKYLVFNLGARARLARKQIISPLKLGSWTDTELSTCLARERATVRNSFLCTVVVISSLLWKCSLLN